MQSPGPGGMISAVIVYSVLGLSKTIQTETNVPQSSIQLASVSPLPASQMPLLLQMGSPTQTPALHTSFIVPASPSSHNISLGVYKHLFSAQLSSVHTFPSAQSVSKSHWQSLGQFSVVSKESQTLLLSHITTSSPNLYKSPLLFATKTTPPATAGEDFTLSLVV